MQRLRCWRSETASSGTAAAGAVVTGVATCGSVQGGVGGPGGGSEVGGLGFSSGLGDLGGRNGNNGSKPLNLQLTKLPINGNFNRRITVAQRQRAGGRVMMAKLEEQAGKR